MKNNKNLIHAVQNSLKKLARDGIRGWGLNMLYYDGVEFGELIEVGPEHGCTSETCNHVSHDPASPTMKWIPPKGYSLHMLGEDGERTFYYLKNNREDDNEEYIIIKIEGGHYHDRLEWGELEEVPEWMLARLNTMTENRRKTERINIRIEPKLKKEFEEYLEETGKTMSWLITKWIKEELQSYKKAQH